jgi:hypothetical protein
VRATLLRVQTFLTTVYRQIVTMAALLLAALLLMWMTASTASAAPNREVWDRIASCESGGDWNIHTGNGYSGGLQFHPDTWRAYGGKGSAHHASKDEQIAVANRVLRAQGWKAWPACSRKLGLR